MRQDGIADMWSNSLPQTRLFSISPSVRGVDLLFSFANLPVRVVSSSSDSLRRCLHGKTSSMLHNQIETSMSSTIESGKLQKCISQKRSRYLTFLEERDNGSMANALTRCLVPSKRPNTENESHRMHKRQVDDAMQHIVALRFVLAPPPHPRF